MTFVYLIWMFVPPVIVIYTIQILAITADLFKVWLVMQLYWAIFVLMVSLAHGDEE